MVKIEEIMQGIGKGPGGTEFKMFLTLLRDQPLLRGTPEETYSRIGQRDLAIELLDYMEEDTKSVKNQGSPPHQPKQIGAPPSPRP